MLTINTTGYITINFFCVWLSQSDWSNLNNNIEGLYGLFAISSICTKAEQNIEEIVKILLIMRKVEWEAIQDLPKSLLKPN